MSSDATLIFNFYFFIKINTKVKKKKKLKPLFSRNIYFSDGHLFKLQVRQTVLSVENLWTEINNLV